MRNAPVLMNFYYTQLITNLKGQNVSKVFIVKISKELIVLVILNNFSYGTNTDIAKKKSDNTLRTLRIEYIAFCIVLILYNLK